MNALRKLLPKKLFFPTLILIGIGFGFAFYILYISNATAYLSDDPKACVNCHIMSPYYQSWQHSAHGRVTTCNDCHVPHENVFSKYYFKAKDGLYHASVFTLGKEREALRPTESSYEVIMNNCIRCHYDLNTTMASTGRTDYKGTLHGEGKACWDCHREVPHTKNISLSSSPNAVVPLPSPVPEWIMEAMKKNEEK